MQYGIILNNAICNRFVRRDLQIYWKSRNTTIAGKWEILEFLIVTLIQIKLVVICSVVKQDDARSFQPLKLQTRR